MMKIQISDNPPFFLLDYYFEFKLTGCLHLIKLILVQLNWMVREKYGGFLQIVCKE